MTKELIESAPERSVLKMASSSLETLSTLLGLTTYIEPALRTRAAPSLPSYSLSQVSDHCWTDDCWIVLYDKVYNVTRFLSIHPAGMEIIMESAGRDATNAFRGVGHSEEAVDMLKEYQIGVLVEEECMWGSAK